MKITVNIRTTYYAACKDEYPKFVKLAADVVRITI